MRLEQPKDRLTKDLVFDTLMVDTQKYGGWVRRLGIDIDELPGVVMIHKNAAHVYPYDGDHSVLKIRPWVIQYFNRRLKPKLRSVKPPTIQASKYARQVSA